MECRIALGNDSSDIYVVKTDRVTAIPPIVSFSIGASPEMRKLLGLQYQ